jgi:hypothetical protein
VPFRALDDPPAAGWARSKAADEVAANILKHSVTEESAIATLKELAHESFQDTIGKAGEANRDRAGKAGEEPGPLGDHRARSWGGRRDRGAAPDAGEGPEFANRAGDQSGLFDSGDEEQSQVDTQRDTDRLLHDQLTAQIKSGLPAKPSKLKLTQNRGLFDEQGPEQESLFGGGIEPLPDNENPLAQTAVVCDDKRSMDEQPKPTIDERLEAIAQSVELLTRDVREMQQRMDAADLRERKARRAFLIGIQAYLEALDTDDNGDNS